MTIPDATAFDWLTVLAILTGPIAAVFMTRFVDHRRQKAQRRHDVFAALMKTRMFRLSADHIAALNMIQVEYYGVAAVTEAYARYIDSLNEPDPLDEDGQRYLAERRGRLFVELVHSMASKARYHLDKSDLEKLAYGPRGWFNDEAEIRAIRRGVLEVLGSRRPLGVFNWGQPQGPGVGPFPPVPNAD